jgi:predicted flap endonuclease-1-like 5' DNA nuclease
MHNLNKQSASEKSNPIITMLWMIGLVLGALIGWWFFVRLQHKMKDQAQKINLGKLRQEIEISPEEPASQPAIDHGTPEQVMAPGGNIQAVKELVENKTAKKDRLEDITGIGPVYARKLRAMGVNTFADLAIANKEKLQEIVSPRARGLIDVDDWIRQAKEIVAR